MKDFVAIDFETANQERTSVCSVGVVIVREGAIVDQWYSLIRPYPNYYSYWNTQVHGLTRRDTDKAPLFPEVWAAISPRIGGLPLVDFRISAFAASNTRSLLEFSQTTKSSRIRNSRCRS